MLELEITQIAFVVYPGVTALDVVGPYEALRLLPGADVRFVWHETGPIVTDSGVLVIGATHTFAETPHPDVVVVPGGSGSVLVRARDGQLLEWLRAVNGTATWMTSVCFGSVILAAAGLLDGKRATSHWQAMALLRSLGAIPVSDERVVVEGNFATSAGVSAGLDLALWLCGNIANDAIAKAIQLALEYDPDPPYTSGTISSSTAATRALAASLLARDSINPAQMSALGSFIWDGAIRLARNHPAFSVRQWLRPMKWLKHL